MTKRLTELEINSQILDNFYKLTNIAIENDYIKKIDLYYNMINSSFL